MIVKRQTMAAETQDRWTEIRKLHVDWKDAYRILGGVVLVGIGVVIGAGWFANPQADSYTTNLYTEFISIGVTVFILDFLNRRRDDRRRIEDLKAQLLRQVRSPENSVAKHAIHEMREHGWLEGEGGLLKGVDLRGANLQGAKLWGANLQGAELGYSDLQGANLRKADLQGADLFGANLGSTDLAEANLGNANLLSVDLKEARLWETNLKGANLRDTNLFRAVLKLSLLNMKTVLPDAKVDTETKQFTPDSYWTPKTDMRRYTDPAHPDFWQPGWVKAQGGGG